jgi:Flp pilus assembly protein TadD
MSSAPNWGGLHLAWGRALDRLGRSAAAREQYLLAARLDLGLAERRSLPKA